jgi:hypothetical protein
MSAKSGGKAMHEAAIPLAILAVWMLLQLVVLPRLGSRARMSEPCSPAESATTKARRTPMDSPPEPPPPAQPRDRGDPSSGA